jgi:hypothetical protein
VVQDAHKEPLKNSQKPAACSFPKTEKLWLQRSCLRRKSSSTVIEEILLSLLRMARNTAFIPASPPGEISKLTIAMHADDEAFKALLITQQEIINLAYGAGDEAIRELFIRSMELPSGPCSVLGVTQSSGASDAQVMCFHALRTYQLGSLVPPGTDPGLVDKIVGFVGEIIMEDGITTLPQCMMRPENVVALTILQSTRVPEDLALAAAFAAYDTAAGATATDELMSTTTAAEDEDLPKLLFIPTVLLPLFAMPQSPRQALRKIGALSAGMPEERRQMLGRAASFLRASCVKKGGNGNTRDHSRMSTMWTVAPASSRPFRKWQRDVMRSLYADAFLGLRNGGAPAGVTSLFGADAAEAFGTSLGTAANSAMAQLGDKLKEARAEERREDDEEKTKKSKWSEMAQNRILRCHGFPSHTIWDETNVSEIWSLYQQAMREGTSPVTGIVETFAAVFHKEPNALDGERPTLAISTTTAKCIKQGRLCPPRGLLQYETVDEGLMPLAFRHRGSSEILEDTYQEEEYERSNHRTLEGEKARSGRAKIKKAPDTYSDTIGLLRGYAEVLRAHFSVQSSGFIETNRLFQALARRQDTWKPTWDGTIGARFWWLFSRAVYEWMSPSEWAYGGAAPTMDVSPIINCIFSGNFPQQVDMPVQLIKLQHLPPPNLPSFGGDPAQNQTTPGNGFQTKTNPNVHPKIKSGIWPALDKFGGRTTLRTLMNYAPAAVSPLKFYSTIISDAQCQEFVVSGRCVDRLCQRKHDASYSPSTEQVDKFLAKVGPIVAYVLANDTATLEKGRKRMRPRA